MNISWKWLLEYVRYDGPRDEATGLMTMAGLNVDSVEELPGGDARLDVEVTSNRPDCLGHLGVARELAALTGCEFVVPEAGLPEGDEPVEKLTSVRVDDPRGCPRYTARVIRGVKIGPSPRWLAERIEAVGMRPVNNVVDVTNFVLYEHGQPLHAFDYDLLAEHRIVVRRAARGETFVAIDHSQHRLEDTDLVIADAARPVALAGVMGGADSEVTDQTTNVLMESAVFDPLTIRTTSRARQLMSDSSYRFERGVDWDGTDWASRRACRLILEAAGGTLARGAVDIAEPPPEAPVLTLRFDQVPRLLGVDVPRDEIVRILKALGLTIAGQDRRQVRVVPPRFRRDLVREVDLIEEVARIHGYDKVPYLRHIPTIAPQANRRETVTETLREVLVAAGFYEAITLTLTDVESAALFSQGDASPPLVARDTGTTGTVAIRKSVLPGLLQAKRANQYNGLGRVSLFEIARGFRDAGADRMPHESVRVALLTDDGDEAGRGVLETIAEQLNIGGDLAFEPVQRIGELCSDGQADVMLNGTVIGFCGAPSSRLAERYKFRHVPWVAEVEFDPLMDAASLVPRYRSLPQLPAIERDVALVVDEGVLWRDLEASIRGAGVAELESVACASVYRGKPIREGRKCLAVRLRFRGRGATLTHEEADAFQARILKAAGAAVGAELRKG